jgi:hypothetical protein
MNKEESEVGVEVEFIYICIQHTVHSFSSLAEADAHGR